MAKKRLTSAIWNISYTGTNSNLDVTAAALWPTFIGLGHGKQQVLKKMDDFFQQKLYFMVQFKLILNYAFF